MNKRIYLASPHMGGYEKAYIDEAFDTNWIAPLGPNVDGFEKEICDYADVKSAAALSSGSAAIHMALKAVGINEGDYIFCSSLTFSASCNPVMYEKGIPVFIDSEPESWNMSPIALEKAFKHCEMEGKFPKAVIVVNLYGQSADFDKIIELCNKYNVPIIEDAAESLGATYKNKFTGSIGKYGVY
ncbi:DegT/DnrJ/EryC1/StrS family aminotransferase, partial [Clostridium sp.]|uniref:DegT/DnrJ/EryC1/StrS family aminotransferase n=1 Tax=Clostridium sp. TaxID=1506 RepID=UPI003463C313